MGMSIGKRMQHHIIVLRWLRSTHGFRIALLLLLVEYIYQAPSGGYCLRIKSLTLTILWAGPTEPAGRTQSSELLIAEFTARFFKLYLFLHVTYPLIKNIHCSLLILSLKSSRSR
jgi:hypothetical protein